MKISLDGQWKITGEDGQSFPGTVPGTVYTSMLEQGLCADPFIGLNDEPVRKISDKNCKQ